MVRSSSGFSRKGRKIATVARRPGLLPASRRPRLVEGSGGFDAAVAMTLPLEIQRQPALDRPPRPHPVHRLLHLAIPPVPPLHRVRRRPQEALVQEHQRLLQARRPPLLQHLAEPAGPPPPRPPAPPP